MQIQDKHYIEVKGVNGRGLVNVDIFNYKLETHEDGDKTLIQILNSILEDNKALQEEIKQLKKQIESYQFREDKADSLMVDSLDLLQKKVTRLELRCLKDNEEE